MSELSPFDHKKSVYYTGNTKDRATRTPFKAVGEHGCSGRVSVPAPHVASVVLFLLQVR